MDKWEAKANYPQPNYDITCDNGRRTIAETITAPHEEHARLIAAAPELLEALQECITDAGATCFKNGMNRATLMTRRLMAINDIARAAIAKATGRKIVS